MILAQNWPKTAKFSLHITFKLSLSEKPSPLPGVDFVGNGNFLLRVNSSINNGLLISFTSFGSKYRSTRTGIIYDNEMNDFSTPGKKNAYGVEPSESNMIYPGKRPQSSTAPSLFLDKRGCQNMVAMETASHVDDDMSYQLVAR